MTYNERVKMYQNFLESIEQITPNKSAMKLIKASFNEYHPLHENEEPSNDILNKVISFFKGHIDEDKLNGFAKGIVKGMEAAKLTDVATFVKKALNSNPKEEFIDAAKDFLGGNEALTEAVSDNISKLVKVLAVAAMLAGNANAGWFGDDKYEKVNKTEVNQDNIETTVKSFVDAIMADEDFANAMESGENVKEILPQNKLYKEIVSKYNDINKKDTNLANAFARGINGALKKMFSSDAPLIGQQHSS